MNTTITYRELADRLPNLYMFNKAPELDENLYDNLQNGSLFEDDESEEAKDVFQWYLIGQNDAEYVMRHTDELIFYSDVLDEYIWGVTHWGTPWEGVELTFYDDKPEAN